MYILALVLGMFFSGIVGVRAQANLIPNGDFESVTDRSPVSARQSPVGWTVNADVASWIGVGTMAQNGESLQNNGNGTKILNMTMPFFVRSGTGWQPMVSQYVTVPAGTYILRINAMAPFSKYQGGLIYIANASNQTIAGSQINVPVSNTFQTSQVSLNLPANGYHIRMKADGGSQVYWDSVELLNSSGVNVLVNPSFDSVEAKLGPVRAQANTWAIGDWQGHFFGDYASSTFTGKHPLYPNVDYSASSANKHFWGIGSWHYRQDRNEYFYTNTPGFTLEAGKTYKLSFGGDLIYKGTGRGIQVPIMCATGGGCGGGLANSNWLTAATISMDNQSMGSKIYELSFSVPSTNTYNLGIFFDAGAQGVFDNFSLTEVVPLCKSMSLSKATLSSGESLTVALRVDNGASTGVLKVFDKATRTQVGDVIPISMSGKEGTVTVYSATVSFEDLVGRGAGGRFQINGYVGNATAANGCESYVDLVIKPPVVVTPGVVVKNCYKTGCSGTICSDSQITSSCQYKDEYACYEGVECKLQANNECGWTTPQATIDSCIATKTGCTTDAQCGSGKSCDLTTKKCVALPGPTRFPGYVEPGAGKSVGSIDMGGSCDVIAGDVSSVEVFSSCPADVMTFEGPAAAKTIKFYKMPANADNSCTILTNYYDPTSGNTPSYIKLFNACKVNANKCTPCTSRVGGYAGPGLDKGDANCNGSVGPDDFNEWEKEYYSLPSYALGTAATTESKAYRSDYNCDSKVNKIDYSLWLNNVSL